MELLISFALKSLLIAGVTLGLLHLLRRRSAAERSMVAHFGLLALLLVPIGSMVLPQVVVEAPLLGATVDPVVAPDAAAEPAVLQPDATPLAATAPPGSNGVDVMTLWPVLYGFPAALLLGVTLLAVLRLLALRARASVMVDPSWLSALAHAQRRMNFKHGTALLSSSDLKSPISWGVIRPVILLNDEAIEARHEAEAIIAHELAHVRGLDWAKLLLARIVTAMFWFNPLVWILSREAHQLREETADDAVLAADVASTDYAQLLVGVARHECKGLLLASHGVAPGRHSLSRRVRRVLDAGLPRTPAGRGFAAGVALGAVAAAAPLAAVTFTAAPAAVDTSRPYYVSKAHSGGSLPSIVAGSVVGATAATGDVVAATVSAALAGEPVDTPSLEKAIEAKLDEQADVRLAMAHPHPDPGPVIEQRVRERLGNLDDGYAVAWKALGITPEYAAGLRAAAPKLRIADEDVVAMRAAKVTPEWLRSMIAAGYPARDVGDLAGARAIGVDPAYISELAAAGYRKVPLDELTSMRALGINSAYIRRLRSHGITGLSVDELIERRARSLASVRHKDVRRPPAPPAIPVPPGDFKQTPPDWDGHPDAAEEEPDFDPGH